MLVCLHHTDFKAGYIRWDDENIRNSNKYTGQLPDGVYDKNTHIEYCWRMDGHATNAIILPTDSPFVMLKSNTHLCQMVKGMKVRSEYFHWDCEDWFPKNRAGGSRPYASSAGISTLNTVTTITKSLELSKVDIV